MLAAHTMNGRRGLVVDESLDLNEREPEQLIAKARCLAFRAGTGHDLHDDRFGHGDVGPSPDHAADGSMQG
jgi:hypothetical protein